MPERIEPRKHRYVGKAGGDACFNPTVGYLRRVVDGDFPAPSVLVASAPGRDPNDPKSKKATEHVREAVKHHAAGDRVERDRSYEHVVAMFTTNLDKINATNETRAEVADWMDAMHGRIRTRAPVEGMPEMIQGITMADYIPNSVLLEPSGLIYQDPFGMVDGETTKRRSRAALNTLKRDATYIIPPHNATTPRGHVIELGPGSGDPVAGWVSRALRHPLFVYKITDGVQTAHPGIVSNTLFIPEMTFKELHASTLGGAGVVQAETVRSVEADDDGYMEVRNFMDPDKEGTAVFRTRKVSPEELALMVTGVVGGEALDIIIRGGASEIQLEARIKAAFERHRLPINHVVAGAGGATILLDKGTFPHESKDFRRQLERELGVDSIRMGEGRGILALVGHGLLLRSAQAFRGIADAFDEAGIQASKFQETGHASSYSTLVEPKVFEDSIRAFHNHLVLNSGA